MSKSSWKEHPNCLEEADYAFLDGAPPVVWAWEVLRRNPEYRVDWLVVESMRQADGIDWMKQPNAIIHFPPKSKTETKSQWQNRAFHLLGVDPTTKRIDDHFAEKWGLEALINPCCPYTPKVRFLKPSEQFPRLIVTPEDFSILMQSYGDDEEYYEVGVAREIALLAIDMTRPIKEQLKMALSALSQEKKRRLAAKQIKKATGHANKKRAWKRHIRVLDAVNMKPRMTDEEIALNFGPSSMKSADTFKRREAGSSYVRAARKQMLHGYQKMALARVGKIVP